MRIFLPKPTIKKLPITYTFPTNDKRAIYHYETSLFILWQLMRFKIRNYKNNKKWCDLSSKHLSKIDRNYGHYIKLFNQLNIIEINHSYCPEVQSKGYRLIYNQDDKAWWINLKTKKIINKYHRLLKNKSTIHYSPEQLKRLNYLRQVRIELKKAGKWLSTATTSKGKSYTPIEKAIILKNCIMINQEEPYLVVSRYGREFSNICNLPSYIRNNYLNFIKQLNNENNINSIKQQQKEEEEDNISSLCYDSFVEIDIPTSQPRFLIKWLNNKNINQDEYKRYISDVLNQDFYQIIADRYNKTYGQNKTRNDMKVPLLSTMYGKSHWTNKHTEIYRSLYPSIYACLSNFKQGKHEVLAQELQRLEADWIFGFCVALECVYFTVHDAIFIPAGNEEIKNRFFNSLTKEFSNEMYNL